MLRALTQAFSRALNREENTRLYPPFYVDIVTSLTGFADDCLLARINRNALNVQIYLLELEQLDITI